MCRFDEIQGVGEELASVLSAMRGHTNYTMGDSFMSEVIARDVVLGCEQHADRAMLYRTATVSLQSRSCVQPYGSPQFLSDPCCNKLMQGSMCCAERQINAERQEIAGVNATVRGHARAFVCRTCMIACT